MVKGFSVAGLREGGRAKYPFQTELLIFTSVSSIDQLQSHEEAISKLRPALRPCLSYGTACRKRNY